MMKLVSLASFLVVLLWSVIVVVDVVEGYTYTAGGTLLQPPPPLLLPGSGNNGAMGLDANPMMPGFNPFPLPPMRRRRRRGGRYWGYDEGMPLTRYADFNDYRRGVPAEWGPMAPMGAYGPGAMAGYQSPPRFTPYLEEIKRRPNLSNREVQELFFLWNDALASLNPDAVARRYSRNAVLLATVSDVPRTDYNAIRDYFVEFLKKRPQGIILKSHVTQGMGWCMDAGIYEFTMGSSGERVTARYTFLYTFEDGEWKISHHHSSTMPEKSSGKTPSRARWLGHGVMMQV
jgi:uncharacterized protein (TIGR02246 family)